MSVNHSSHDNPTLRGGLCNTATGSLPLVFPHFKILNLKTKFLF